MSDTFNLLLTQVEKTKLKFVNEQFKNKIYEVVSDFFQNLNSSMTNFYRANPNNRTHI